MKKTALSSQDMLRRLVGFVTVIVNSNLALIP